MNEIRYEDVSCRYPGSSGQAVKGVRLTVQAGELLVLLGPSGCGKTTLLKMTNRLVEPTAGRITLDGTDIRDMNITRLRRSMGYVIQQVGLFPHLTVAQNVAVVPELMGWERPRIQARVDALLDLVHLQPEEFRGRYPARLSGGQQQRVGLARALAADPGLLLMDEPFGAIDAITRASLQQEIIDLHRRLRKTIVFVTHDVEEALLLADRIAVLRAGELVQVGTPCELLTRPADAFVRDLLGAGDRVRALGLMTAGDFAKREGILAGGAIDGPKIQAAENLRRALSMLLEPGVEALVVLDGQEEVGRLTLEQIRRAGCEEQR